MPTYPIHVALLAVAILTAGCARYDTPVVEADATPSHQGGEPVRRARDHDSSLPVIGGSCALDSVSGIPADQARPRSGETVVFGGWVGDGEGQTPETAELVMENDENSFRFELRPRLHRPDVAAALGHPGLEYSGFDVQVSLSAVPAGRYRTSVLIPANPTIECSFGRDVLIESAN